MKTLAREARVLCERGQWMVVPLMFSPKMRKWVSGRGCESGTNGLCRVRYR